MKVLSLMALSIFTSAIAQAGIVNIADRRCVPAPVDHVAAAITDYTNYAKIPEATLTILGMSILKMTKSQEIKKVAGRIDDSIVYIELRPLNFGDDKKDLFPRFFIRCKVTTISDTQVKHECHNLTANDLSEYGRPGAAPVPFGLAHFDSELLIDGDPKNCGAGQSLMTYTLALDPNDADVNKIQNGSGFGGFPLPQEQFFKAYYQNFYNGWTKTVH